MTKININYKDIKSIKKLEHIIINDKNFINNIERLSTKITLSWKNLLNEWFTKKSYYHKTCIYFAKVKSNSSLYKIGITMSPRRRYSKKDSKYFNLKVIREFDNRYQAAYVEYKLRTLFCERNELIDKNNLNKVIEYVNNIHYNKDIEEELKILEWKF